MIEETREKIIGASLLAGKIMLESGAETSRVEDTMERLICYALGREKEHHSYTYVMVNGIFVQIDQEGSHFVRIDTRDHDLEKVTKVNQISRSFIKGEITLEEVCQELQEIEHRIPTFPLWLKLISTALLSGSVMFLFDGQVTDLPAAMIAGLVCYLCYLFGWRTIKAPFLVEYLSAFVAGVIAYSITEYLGSNLDSVMIGTVAPLVPGIAITNATRDIIAKHYLSGLIRGLEALFIAGAIGTGIATVYYLFIL